MEKDKIKRFIDCYVPVTTCNLRCHYCYITQQRKFDAKLPEFKYSAEYIAKALSKERLGGVCCLNFCGGGETLLPPEMIGIIRKLLEEGHYVMVVTNGTMSNRFDEISQMPKELLERLFIKFSFHFLEMKRLKMMDKFFDNIRKVRDAGASFTLEITPSDELIPYIEEVKDVALKNLNALPHITVARNNTVADLPILTSLSKPEYKKIWGQFKSGLFDYKISVFNKKRKEFCYAGDWTSYLNIGTGVLKQCYKGDILQNIYENIEEPIRFCAIGNNCRQSHCYNAHAWLTFGAIPEHKAPTYIEMRDRICTDGSHWCGEKVRDFFSQKLVDSNRKYTLMQKRKINKKYKKKTSGKLLEKIFSVKNDCPHNTEKVHKIVTILGARIKFKVKNKKLLQNQICFLKQEINTLKENQRSIRLYLELERLDRQIKEMAPKDQMIFVCINGTGDTMMYASYWKELEAKYGTKIFWVVVKSHEVILKMYGITNYMVLENMSVQKQGTFSDAVNITTTPIKGIPFYAHWTYNKTTRVREKYFLDFVRNSMDLKGLPLNHPIWYPEIDESLQNKISAVKDLSRTILISPDARWLPLNDVNLWNLLIKELKLAGYEVIVNDFLHKLKLNGAVSYSDFTNEELVALAKNCYATISARSGFTDIMHELGEKLFVLYTNNDWLKLYTLNGICSTSNVNEYVISPDFSVKQIIADLEKISCKEAAQL